MNTELRTALADAAYSEWTSRLPSDCTPSITADAWIELRAASAVLQTHGGHHMVDVSAFLLDMSAFPQHLTPPPDLRERLVFAYSFILSQD